MLSPVHDASKAATQSFATVILFRASKPACFAVLFQLMEPLRVCLHMSVTTQRCSVTLPDFALTNVNRLGFPYLGEEFKIVWHTFRRIQWS